MDNKDKKKLDISNLDITQILDSLPKSNNVSNNTNVEPVKNEKTVSTPSNESNNTNANSNADLSSIIPDAPVEVENSIDNKTTLDSNAINIEQDSGDLPSFNNNAATIGTLKPDKQKSPFAMFVLFTLLICFIIFMPQIINFVNKYLGTNFNANDGVILNEGGGKKEETQDNDINIYTISDDLSIKLGDIVVSKFKKKSELDSYSLEFVVENNSSEIYSFTRKLYLDFYNSNNTFIERKLVLIDDIKAKGNVTSSVTISKEVYDTGNKVEAIFRSVDDYPNVTLENNRLVCTKDNKEIIFVFRNDKLTNIHDKVTYKKGVSLDEYSSKLMDAKTRINSLDKVNGVTAALTEGDGEFITTVDINYDTASFNDITYKDDYYERDTFAKQIKFELVSKNYKCD